MKSKEKATKIWIIIASITVLFAVVWTIVSFIVNDKSYTHAEKKWISDNINNVIDIYVDTDLPIFSYSGSGVFYDYLTALEKDTGLSFNIIYNDSVEYKMINSTKEDGIVFYKDHYIIMSKTKKEINTLNDIEKSKVGILDTDIETVKIYLSDYPSIAYNAYKAFEDMKVAFKSGAIDMAIVPLYVAMEDIIKENYVIDYHIDGFNTYYELKLGTNTELNGIMQKFYDRWQNKSISKFNEHLAALYYKTKGYTELEKDSIINDDYVVGYVDNLPYEGILNNTFSGLSSTYLTGMASLSGATYRYVLYPNPDKLLEALANKKVDIVANYYDIISAEYDSSNTFKTGDYVVLTHKDDPLTIETLSTLTNSEVNMLSRMSLTSIMKSKSLFSIKEHTNIKYLLDNIDKNSIIIVDKDVYEYYKNKGFKNYVVKYDGNVTVNNSFLLNSEKKAFNNLFNFYISINSDKEMRSLSVKKMYGDERNNLVLSFILKNVIYIVVLIVAIAFVIYKLLSRVKLSKKIKKDDKLLYIDVMTNLKNRNYLNDNINYWEENKVYPQTVVVVDINNMKELNDRRGHEEGDKQIKALANVLIKTQRDNSEIMRTNGDEFMIYLVGYDEKSILSYVHKLAREITSNLPYKEYGVSLGYAMINNDLSSIDDAINEALAVMRKNKGINSEK